MRQSLHDQLQQHHDQLEHWIACQQFTHQAILALTEPERFEAFDGWHFGFFLHQQWLQQQGQKISEELSAIQQALESA